jgi:hypothetical protein
MCVEKTKYCPQCYHIETIKWEYCAPYMKYAKITSTTGMGPPAITFKRELHNPAIDHQHSEYYTPDNCPDDDCPSKIKDDDK